MFHGIEFHGIGFSLFGRQYFLSVQVGIDHDDSRIIIGIIHYPNRHFRKSCKLAGSSSPVTRYDFIAAFFPRTDDPRLKYTLFLNALNKLRELFVNHPERMILEFMQVCKGDLYCRYFVCIVGEYVVKTRHTHIA